MTQPRYKSYATALNPDDARAFDEYLHKHERSAGWVIRKLIQKLLNEQKIMG